MRYLDPKNDLIFKRVFGEHPKITISFLNALLPLETGQEILEIEYMQTELVPESPAILKNSIVDVRCRDSFGRQFIVEMQMFWTDAFMNRVLFNATKVFYRQLLKGVDYVELMPVYALSIVNEKFDKETQDWYHHYQMKHQKDPTKTLDALHLIFVELPKFTSKNPIDKKLTVLWLRYLSEMHKLLSMNNENFPLPPEILEAIELTKESNYTPEQLLAYDKYLDGIRTQEMYRKDAEARGKAIGEVIGEARGEARGEEKLKAVAQKLKNRGIFTNEEIAETTGLSLSEVELL